MPHVRGRAATTSLERIVLQMPQPRQRSAIYQHMVGRGTQVGPPGKVSRDVGFWTMREPRTQPSEAKYNLKAGPPDKLEKIPSSILPAFANIFFRKSRTLTASKKFWPRNLWKLMANKFWSKFSQTMKTISLFAGWRRNAWLCYSYVDDVG